MKRLITLLCIFITLTDTIPYVNAQSNKKKKEKIFETLVEKADKVGIGEKIPGWSLIKAKATGKKTLMGLSIGYGSFGISSMDVPDVTLSPSQLKPFEHASFDGGDQWSMRLKIIFYRNKQFSIHTGIGYESNILKFKDVDIWTMGTLTSSADEKIVARYVTVPIQFKYKMAKSFSVHAGLICGVNINTSHTGEKFFWTSDGMEYSKRAKYSEFNPFKVDAQAGITLYHVTFYMKYGMINMFKDASVYSLHPLSFGISLGI